MSSNEQIAISMAECYSVLTHCMIDDEFNEIWADLVMEAEKSSTSGDDSESGRSAVGVDDPNSVLSHRSEAVLEFRLELAYRMLMEDCVFTDSIGLTTELTEAVNALTRLRTAVFTRKRSVKAPETQEASSEPPAR